MKNLPARLASTPETLAHCILLWAGEGGRYPVGEPEGVIVENARELNAGLVIVGNAARSGISALINGNTVEKVVDRLECDILSMP